MRQAFTLLELLLVLTLLVIAAAIASTSVTAGGDRSQLRRAANDLRAAWSEARLRAINEGQPIVFRARIGSGWGYVGKSETPPSASTSTATVDGADPPSTAPGSGTSDALADAGTDVESTALEIDGVVFERVLVVEEPGGASLGAVVGEGGLSAMIVFYPDGAATDAEATLAAASGRQIQITLRGLTGAVRINEDPVANTAGATL